MDSTQYAAAVADKTLDALDKAGISVASAARESGIPRSTLDRKFNSGKGIQALTVRELYELARVGAHIQPRAAEGRGVMSDTRIEFAPALMTRDIAAFYLSMSTRDLDRLRDAGHLTAVGDSKRVKYLKKDLDAYAESLPERATP